MKKIICFGDSNTFGFNPQDGNRYDSRTRWTGVLSKLLGNDFQVIEEGCNNRTGFFQNSDGLLQSGPQYLPECLEKHKNFDIFILALGTNDLQMFFKIDETIVKDGLKKLVNFVRKSNNKARIIIISPVVLNDNVLRGYFNYQFDESSIESSIWIQPVYKTFAGEVDCELLDLNKFVTPSNIDGLHFDIESHKIMAEQIAKQILCEKQKEDDRVEFAGHN